MDEAQINKIRQAAELSDSSVIDLLEIQQATSQLLQAFGEDPQREGLLRTPERVARMYEELLSGYFTDPLGLVNGAIFEEAYNEMVLVRDIEFHSLCEHHLLPFIGRAHVAYIPDGRLLGLSKIPRIVDMFAHRLQVQERLTRQIGDFLNVLLKPKGVAIVVEAAHLCSMIRGVRKHEARMTTSSMKGVFQSENKLRNEFFEQVNSGGTIKSGSSQVMWD